MTKKRKTKYSKGKRLTIKQRKWVEAYIKTGNATEAAMQAYDCKDRNSASVIGTENLGKLSLTSLMEEMGLSDARLLGIGIEGMTKANKFHGGADSFVEIPDYSVRHKYWETILKLKKRLGPESVTNVQQNVIPILGGLTESSIPVEGGIPESKRQPWQDSAEKLMEEGKEKA